MASSSSLHNHFKAMSCLVQALEKYNIEKDIAAFIKKEFDRKYNPTWHCIVGRNFGETLPSQCCTAPWRAAPARLCSAEQLRCSCGIHSSVSQSHLAASSQRAYCRNSHAYVVALHCGGQESAQWCDQPAHIADC